MSSRRTRPGSSAAISSLAPRCAAPFFEISCSYFRFDSVTLLRCSPVHRASSQPRAHQKLSVCHPRKPEACPYLLAVLQPGLLSDCQSPLTGYWRDMRWHTSVHKAGCSEQRWWWWWGGRGGDKNESRNRGGKKTQYWVLSWFMLLLEISKSSSLSFLSSITCTAEWGHSALVEEKKQWGRRRLCSEFNVESDLLTPHTVLSPA